MDILQGKSASKGIAKAKLFVLKNLHSDKSSSIKKECGTKEEEWNKFLSAKKCSYDELSDLIEKAKNEAGEEISILFETHQMMIDDPDFEDAVKEKIFEEHKSALTAVNECGTEFAQMFEEMEDPYMRERSADIKDVAKRIEDNISGNKQSIPIHFSEKVILAADDLSPSETVQLDKKNIVGFALSKGSMNGHTSILARMMGIPLVILLGEKVFEKNNSLAILDGINGKLITEPDEQTQNDYDKLQNKELEEKILLETLKGKKTETKSGQSIKIYCNIAEPKDVDSVLKNDGEGIGLYRTEMLFLNSSSCPNEEIQFSFYKSVLEQMQHKEVIIRTMDIGADKQADCLSLPNEENPALGLRAIRMCLTDKYKSLFVTQLRAIYRASAFGNACIMFPMIANVWELKEAKALCKEVQDALSKEGISYDSNVKCGIMIETPAAALISQELAKEADFFSIGTNDLTQYTLACDRQNTIIEKHYDPHHEAVLSLIALTAENAHKQNIPVGICGELAADETLLDFYLKNHIDELSVSPSKVLPLRALVMQKS